MRHSPDDSNTVLLTQRSRGLLMEHFNRWQIAFESCQKIPSEITFGISATIHTPLAN